MGMMEAAKLGKHTNFLIFQWKSSKKLGFDGNDASGGCGWWGMIGYGL